MNLSCFFDPAACVDQAVTTWVNWFPFGIEGVKAVVWMAVGAILGKVGVALVVGLVLALKVSGKTDDVHEHIAGDEDAVRAPVPRPTVLKRRKR